MPTLRGLRRRGYPAAAIREFCAFIGVARTNSRHQIELLESFVRNELNRTAQRRMAVLRPLRMVVTDWPTDADGNPLVEQFEIQNNPENEADGTRSVAFSRRAVHRARRLHARPAAQVLPALARARGAPARRVPRDVHARRRRRRRQRDDRVRDARPRFSGRHRTGRPQGEIDDALGVGRARRAGDGRVVRPAVHRRGSGRRRPTIRSTISTASRAS